MFIEYQNTAMRVTLKANGGKVEVDAAPSLTVRELKSEIQNTTGISPEYQYLFCKSTRLDNLDATLGEYVGIDDTIEISIHLNGGCGESCQCCGIGESCWCTIL